MEAYHRLKLGMDHATNGKGTRVMIQLFTTYFFFCKAMARDLVLSTQVVYFTRLLGASSNITDNMITAARSPFGIKTLWGALSDVLPFFGYHKRWYIVWGVTASFLSLLGLIAIAQQDREGSGVPGKGIVALTTIMFFLFEYGGATVDSLSQARYTELMKLANDATIISFVWFMMQMASLPSSFMTLILKDEGPYDILLWIALPLCLPMIIPAALNFLDDPPASSCCKPDMKKVTKHGGIFAMSMVLAFGALGGSGLLIVQAGTVIKLTYYAALGTIFSIMNFMILPPAISKPAFYMFLCSTFRLFFSGTLQNWYTSPNKLQEPDNFCIENGPGFPTSRYLFVGNFVGAIAGSIAVIIFQNVIMFWQVRPAFWITTIFQMGSTFLELMILERWNHSLLGTDPLNADDAWVDNVSFIVGAQAIDKIVEMLDFMPCNVLIGKLCPESMEATIFAVLAGSQNFGSNLAFLFGAVFVETLGATLSLNSQTKKWDCTNPGPGEVKGFEWVPLSALGIARFAGGFVLPALTIPFTFFLLPPIGLNDDFIQLNAEGQVEMSMPGQQSTRGGPFVNGQVETSITAATMMTLGSVPHGGISTVSAHSLVSLSAPTRSMPGATDHMI